jgi:hypothetical protein
VDQGAAGRKLEGTDWGAVSRCWASHRCPLRVSQSQAVP